LLKKLKQFFNRFEEFELHHKILIFLIILILTVVLTRFGVLFYNPNPVIFNFELHHFDYGMLLMMISILLILFGPKKYYLYLFISAVSFGLVLDELWFIRKSIIDPNITDLGVYNQTFPIVVLLIMVLIIIVLLINYFKRHHIH
jgi:hypothetical protein